MARKLYITLEEETDDTGLNLTPLLDVVFVLLICFILIAPILNVEHVDLACSGVHAKKEVVHTPLVIQIRSDNTIWLQDKKTDLVTLKKLLPLEIKSTPQLIADQRCHFGVYQDVKNLLEEVGFEQMDVILR